MKLLVLSDTHGYLSNARDVLNRIGKYMNGVIHLGDHAYDAADLQTEYPDLPFYIVIINLLGALSPKSLFPLTI